MRLSDRNGLIRPIEIPVPDKEESQEPNPDEIPFAVVNLYARRKGYEQVVSKNIQIFAGTTTYQDLEMIPLSEFPDSDNQSVTYNNPPQDL